MGTCVIVGWCANLDCIKGCLAEYGVKRNIAKALEAVEMKGRDFCSECGASFPPRDGEGHCVEWEKCRLIEHLKANIEESRRLAEVPCMNAREAASGCFRAVRAERLQREAEAACVSGFYEEAVPQYRQGIPTHELESLVTAAEVTAVVKTSLRRLQLLKQCEVVLRSLYEISEISEVSDWQPGDVKTEELLDALRAELVSL